MNKIRCFDMLRTQKRCPHNWILMNSPSLLPKIEGSLSLLDFQLRNRSCISSALRRRIDAKKDVHLNNGIGRANAIHFEDGWHVYLWKIRWHAWCGAYNGVPLKRKTHMGCQTIAACYDTRRQLRWVGICAHQQARAGFQHFVSKG